MTFGLVINCCVCHAPNLTNRRNSIQANGCQWRNISIAVPERIADCRDQAADDWIVDAPVHVDEADNVGPL